MKDTSWLTSVPIAHRGLHDNRTLPENSMGAFENAVSHGFGIEFDVYLTLDGKLIVHHDMTLKRTCGIKKMSYKINGDKLTEYKLMNTDYSIPLLSDLLTLVDGKVPLILEIKATNRVKSTCLAVYEAIKDYTGNICIESFDNRIVNWWHKNHPEIVLGQLYSTIDFYRAIQRKLKQYLKVDFLAVGVKNIKDEYFRQIKKLCPEKLIINWTVRTQSQLTDALEYADNYIFESNIKCDEYITIPTLTQ
ncbi:MAG: glycerophosphodiester phosphodiesterase family protein [Christensenellales bacterium]